MTEECVAFVDNLEFECTDFAGLSAEQLIYAAMKGTSVEDVVWIVMNTGVEDWLDVSKKN